MRHGNRQVYSRLFQTDVHYSWSPARKPFGLAENDDDDDGLDHNYIVQYSIISVVVAPNLAETVLAWIPFVVAPDLSHSQQQSVILY